MPRIAVLPPSVADQIAAGEVVERPASVVKELVENALDAGARSIEIAIEDGGRARIRVSDDGSGMEREDAVLALERHATSKIREASDLVGVSSFGFRGEALPSICSVAQIEIETSPADGAGTCVRAAAGRVLGVEEVARRRGTTVSVSALFHNAPARRKFLRGARSEWRGVMDALTNVALVRRDVRLSITHDQKPVLTLPSAESLRARLAALWGAAYAGRFVEVEAVSGTVHVSGLAERPSDVGTAGRRVFLSVNGRAVKDPGVVRAAEAAYRSTIPAGVRPSLFLDLVVAAEDVDVNVHPAKAEVRFRERWMLERAVESAVRRALGTMDSATPLGRRFWHPEPADAFDRAAGAMSVTVDVEVLRETAELEPDGLFARPVDVTSREIASPATASDEQTATESSTTVLAQGEPVVQLRRTYLLLEREDGVVLVDQHSAHERVLYEQFMRGMESGQVPAQRLLFPLTLHLGPAEADAFEEHRDSLGQLGFEIEGFGGHTLIVSAVPAPHPRFDAERCLRETLASLSGDRVASVASRHERLAATVACKAAIKAGDYLASVERHALLASLAATTLPAHDVHGRSTIVHLSWEELERRFGRR